MLLHVFARRHVSEYYDFKSTSGTTIIIIVFGASLFASILGTTILISAFDGTVFETALSTRITASTFRATHSSQENFS